MHDAALTHYRLWGRPSAFNHGSEDCIGSAAVSRRMTPERSFQQFQEKQLTIVCFRAGALPTRSSPFKLSTTPSIVSMISCGRSICLLSNVIVCLESYFFLNKAVEHLLIILTDFTDVDSYEINQSVWSAAAVWTLLVFELSIRSIVSAAVASLTNIDETIVRPIHWLASNKRYVCSKHFF